MDFNSKKIVITGASPDFGQTLSVLFARMGAELFISARTREKADATAKLVKEQTPQAKISTFKLDLAKSSDIVEFVRNLSNITSDIDVLINNASYWVQGDLQDVSDENILETINSTATGSILLTKHLLPLLKASDTPDVVFVNSTASLTNNRHSLVSEAFSAAKSAQSTFADRLRHRLKGSGVRVMTVYPPNFDNTSPLNEQEWNESRSHTELRHLTARNVFESIKFALSQDRICSIDKIISSNNNASKEEVL